MARRGRSTPAISTIVSRRASMSRGAVGVAGRHRAVVAGVHGLQHVERLAAAALADDDAVGPHAQGVAHQLADGDRALAFDVRRPRLERDHVLLAQLQLGRVLDGHDALVVGMNDDSTLSMRRLAGAGAARDEDVEPRLDAGAQEVDISGVDVPNRIRSSVRQRRAPRTCGWSAQARPATSGGMMALTREPSAQAGIDHRAATRRRAGRAAR